MSGSSVSTNNLTYNFVVNIDMDFSGTDDEKKEPERGIQANWITLSQGMVEMGVSLLPASGMKISLLKMSTWLTVIRMQLFLPISPNKKMYWSMMEIICKDGTQSFNLC